MVVVVVKVVKAERVVKEEGKNLLQVHLVCNFVNMILYHKFIIKIVTLHTILNKRKFI